MQHYSKRNDPLPHEMADFDSGLDAFFSGEPVAPKSRTDASILTCYQKVEDRKIAEFERAMSVLDNLDDDAPADFITARFNMADYAGDGLIEKTYEKPNYVSRYDKCFTQVRSLEEQLKKANADQAHQIRAELEKANAAFEVEKGLAFDPSRRETDRIDRWRAGEGRDKYNASRRKREMPNDHTPREVLRAMLPEERAQHDTDMNAKRVWVNGKRKAKFTEEQIEAELPNWWAKRRAKAA